MRRSRSAVRAGRDLAGAGCVAYLIAMNPARRCAMCGLRELEGIHCMCDPCKDRLRREAMSEQAHDREPSDRALHGHGSKAGGH